MSGSTASGVDLFNSPRAWRRSRIHGRRILYVDDEALMRHAVARLLRGAGAVCLGAGTHHQAIALFGLESRLDLAILDFEMPDGDPGRLARRLRGRWPTLPVVGTSGLDRRSEFAARGVDSFLPKPWTLDDLIQVADWSEARSDRLPVLRLWSRGRGPRARAPLESTASAPHLPGSGDAGVPLSQRRVKSRQPRLNQQDDTLRIWSLLQTQWLDVPIGRDVSRAALTWGTFSEAFESCLLGVSLHVGRRVNDRTDLESVVTEVFIENLDALASPLGEQEKLGRLLAAADRLIAKTASIGSDAVPRNRA